MIIVLYHGTIMLQPHSDLKQETDATLCVVPSSHDPHDAMHWLPLVWAISITSCNSAGLQFSLERFLSVQARATVATEHVLSICYSYLLPTLLDLLHTSTAAMLPRKYYNSCGASYIFFICKISTIGIEVCMLAVKQKRTLESHSYSTQLKSLYTMLNNASMSDFHAFLVLRLSATYLQTSVKSFMVLILY